MEKVLLLEPFFTGSHQSWAEGLCKFSSLKVEVSSMSGRHWKWRMYSAAITLAQQFNQTSSNPDLILATDMLDLSTFLGLTAKRTHSIPSAIYFHENQITYPWSPTDNDVLLKRDNQYGFINFKSALAADTLFFNSSYHQHSFLNALPEFLKQFPDYQGLELIDELKAKSQVLSLGIDLKRFDKFQIDKKWEVPLLIWNHRWEYDKNPESFFHALFKLKEEGVQFRVAVLGKRYKNAPKIFEKATSILKEEIVHFGPAKSGEKYAKWLWQGDILPITSRQDFFGQSLVEGIYCNCFPILPNRLAFPTHIPTDLQDRFFYNSETEFYTMLKSAIFNVQNIRKQSFQSFVKHYDWRTLAPIYDTQFKNLISK